MFDFLKISYVTIKKGYVEIFPKFIVKKSKDLMIRGGDFYAAWIEEKGMWSTDEDDITDIVDRELRNYKKKLEETAEPGTTIVVKYMQDSSSGVIDAWHKYCQRQMRQNFEPLDEKIIFANDGINRSDYASKRLPYPLEEGSITAWDKLIGALYDEDNRRKIEWAIGAIVTGDAREIQKFIVFYGSAGTGKSTIIKVIEQLFDGYCATFNSKALGSSSAQFALEPFRVNPMVAIEHDGDLSRIEDNTRLNSLVSHEKMTVNEKHRQQYDNRFKCFLIMGTNKPVKITDGKSGLIRRLIDISPTGNKIPAREYKQLTKQVSFELGAIAWHCKEVYLSYADIYDDYIPKDMLGASNDFYNFILDNYDRFEEDNGVTLKTAWEMYKAYCDEARVNYPLPQRAFKEELKNYFNNYDERFLRPDGTRVRSYYYEFSTDKFEQPDTTEIGKKKKEEPALTSWIDLKEQESIFDKLYPDYIAQYSTSNDTPMRAWDKVKTLLKSLDTKRGHYVKVPENHIVIDFDIKDSTGKKNFALNLEAASKWPQTYTELSKGGEGIHLHYIYSGDVNMLSRIYDENIEVKVFQGGSALRRRLSKCNDLPVATISSGLPLKGDTSVVDDQVIQTEKGIRTTIKRSLNKEYAPYATGPMIDFINHVLDKAYDNGVKYDVSDMRQAIFTFASNSTNQADRCLKIVAKMKFKSEEPIEAKPDTRDRLEAPIAFFDIEIFPNLFVICYKEQGKDKPKIKLINPTASEIEQMLKYRLIGFNCRRYDNHPVYAAEYLSYTVEELYKMSQKIINGSANCFIGNAYNLSYTDVYDFASEKQSLKKWEIDLGLKHNELGLPWDKPVPMALWQKVADYCCDDVDATEAVFETRKGDWIARQILAEMAGLTYNDTTNTLTTKIIFGNNRKPQSQFNYRDLSKPVKELDPDMLVFLKEAKPKMMAQLHGPNGESLLPYFPGYEYSYGKSLYRGIDPKEGGFVFAIPGIHGNVALLDAASMHPNSAICEVLFGVEFTKRFKQIVDGRVNIKHEAWDIVNTMLGGILVPYVQKVLDGEITTEDLAFALKIAINSVYGLTAAKFEHPFKDPRNVDNIVAKRGALFMIDLKYEVEAQGFTVAHIKTDSIKIPDATPEIIQFVMDFGAKYGYDFEHEATYERMCLVNDAVYIAKYATPSKCNELYGYVPKDCKKKGGTWTATGTQFAVPYVFKSLFSKEKLEFKDYCNTLSTQTALYLDMNERLPDMSIFEIIKDVRKRLHDDADAKVTVRDRKLAEEYSRLSDEELDAEINKGHDYKFVGKVGQFTPVKEGSGGGVLLRLGNNDKYASANGTKGYRWMESEMVKNLGKEADIDRKYFDDLTTDAVATISQYGDFEWFVSDDPYIGPVYVDGKPIYDESGVQYA
ncbi:MAG: DUF5906 domain-containing protein [Hungatella sp.]|jgi:phage/plasmid-associated DNA primase|nr:DUF5906 domain-containing protein [Hungatella sp.]